MFGRDDTAGHRGQWVDPTDQTTVTHLVRAHVSTRMHKPLTVIRHDGLIRNHIEPTPFGSRRVATVRPSEVQAWVTDRSKVLAPLTVRILVGLVRSAFNAAGVDRIVGASPFQKIVLPRVERDRIVPLTVEQVDELADVIGDRYRAMVVAQAGLGLRIGELLACASRTSTFSAVRFESSIRLTSAPGSGCRQKTPRSRRLLPLPDVVSTALAEHLRLFPAAPNGLLFHTRDGMPYWHDFYSNKAFARAITSAGTPEGTTSHDLRHHFASVLLAAGLSVVDVAELLGHENATLVLTTYGHLIPGG